MKLPYEHFLHCPRCGQRQKHPPSGPVFDCGGCGFHFHFNPACAGGAFLSDAHGQLLFVRRAKDPAQGKLALPGGFIDYQERAEDALRREIREEVGLEVGPLRFLCSQLNDYDYGEVRYPVVDLFFAAEILPGQAAGALDGVAELCWLKPADVDPQTLAFPSIRAAFRLLCDSLGKP